MKQREIKFRVWDKKLSRFMGDGEVVFYDYGDTRIRANPNSIEYVGDPTHDYYEESRWVIMQFTGLIDKNGKEIYEGDIVKCGDDTLTVTWNKKFASFCLDKNGWMHSHYFGEAADPSQCEVIGNIHLHPELLTNK